MEYGGQVPFDLDSLIDVPAVGFILHRGANAANAEVVAFGLGTVGLSGVITIDD